MKSVIAAASVACLLGMGLAARAQDSVGNPGTAKESVANPEVAKNLERKCGDTRALDAELRGTWHETPIFTSAKDEETGVATLLYISEQGKTWTLVMRFSSDRSCVLNYGEHAKLGDGEALTN